MRFYCKSVETGLHENLALEAHLMETLNFDDELLLLWQAAQGQVVGRNQNPWVECHFPLGGPGVPVLGRRISGGGCVYQDMGNLNYAFFVSAGRYNRTAISRVVTDALAALDIDARVGERDMVVVGDKKVSGTAFYHHRNLILHHGTLLVDANLKALAAAAGPAFEGIVGRQIASVSSPVTNLRSVCPGITVPKVADALVKSWGATVERPMPETAALSSWRTRMGSSEWLFGRPVRFSWSGAIDHEPVKIEVTKGIIDNASTPFAAWIGRPFAAFVDAVGLLKS